MKKSKRITIRANDQDQKNLYDIMHHPKYAGWLMSMVIRHTIHVFALKLRRGK